MLGNLGFDVFTTVLAHESSEHLVEAGLHASIADVTKDQDITLLEDKISSDTGGNLDILVNCAYETFPCHF